LRGYSALVCLALAAHAAAAPAVLRTTPHEDGRPVTSAGEIREDRSGLLDLPAVLESTAGWKAGDPAGLVFGFSKSVYWVRWRLVNDAAAPSDLVVDLGNPRQDYVDWYLLRDGGTRIEVIRSGDRRPYRERPLATRNFALPVALRPGEEVALYVRLASYDGLYEAMPVRLYSRAAFLAEADRENLVLSLYHGGLLALALYNLLLFAATRQRSFALYVGYMLCLLLWNFTFRGYGFQYLWPDAMAFNNNILTVGAAWAFGIFGFFTIEYLNLRESVPRWVLRLNQVFAWLNMAVVLPAAADFYALGAGIGQVTGIGMAAVSLATGVWLLRRGLRQARFFVLAFALLGVGATAYILQVVGVAPPNLFTTWGLQVGSGVESLILALGLADSMNVMKAKMLQAERRLRESQESRNAELNQRVVERTRELEVVNARLAELSVTDELTGALNRRQYNEVCARALAGRQRVAGLAFCMFDIDFFKLFNDRYGHPAGDAALRAIAAAVRADLKRTGDELFRLGGEEFGVLFSAPTAMLAQEFVERLRAIVLGLAIAHDTNPTGFVTASFGVGWWGREAVASLTPEAMYAEVDRQLYRSKSGGRNRVSLFSS